MRACGDNNKMEIQGVVQNGVVVLQGDVVLPDGTVVLVSCPQENPPKEARVRKKVQLPLVPSKHPGSHHLTNEMIAELMNDDDVSR